MVRILIFSFMLCLPVYAYENVPLAKEILKLNETSNDYFINKEVLKKFSNLKESVQTDLKNGNRNARIDILLLLDGLVQDNLFSLQSFLATGNKDTISQEFSEYINYGYAEKLAYALKENKRLLTTEYIIEKTDNKKNCVNYVNGSKISNNSSFFAPAGLPYYIASYCDNNIFFVNKIQSENAQQKYLINLSEQHQNSYTAKQDKSSPSSTKTFNAGHKFFVIGIGYDYFSTEIKDKNISNLGMDYGSLVYSRTSLQHDSLFVALDIAAVSRNVILRQDIITSNGQEVKNNTAVKSKKSQKGYFFRPNVGLVKLLYNLNNCISISGLGYTNVTFLKIQGDSPYSRIFPGFGIAPRLNVALENNFLFNFEISLGLDFPNQKPQLVAGSGVGLGYNF